MATNTEPRESRDSPSPPQGRFKAVVWSFTSWWKSHSSRARTKRNISHPRDAEQGTKLRSLKYRSHLLPPCTRPSSNAKATAAARPWQRNTRGKASKSRVPSSTSPSTSPLPLHQDSYPEGTATRRSQFAFEYDIRTAGLPATCHASKPSFPECTMRSYAFVTPNVARRPQ